MRCEHPSCNADEDILFYCRFCRGSFCEQHRDANKHKCPSLYPNQQTGQSTQGPPPGATQGRPEEVLRRIAYAAQQAAQQSGYGAQPQPQQVHFASEEEKKKFIEKRLINSRGLFSFGNEVIDILAGFAMIVLVFGLSQYIFGGSDRPWIGFVLGALLIGTAFLPHELAHKVVAMRKGQYARYILWVRGMLFTLITLVLGIGLIVPGFVAIVPMSRQMDKKDIGLVSFAGPATNAVIGFICLIFGILTFNGPLVVLTGGPLAAFTGPLAFAGIFANPNIFLLMAQFNGLIALFNCIPVWQLDGKKILSWNKVAYFILVAINLAIVIPSFILNPGFLSGVL